MPEKLYPVMCNWCEKPIPDRYSEVENSHGICSDCKEKQLKLLEEMKKEDE